ncbi:aminotransferase class I/II-fold pyridoxal phosphate-dependent enzyme [Vulcanisaeta souniana]|uniref:Aminotransferase n=1 Tax=Vulcanisaeta souniana JCM 11219 TaxID=1293586 RepID=A0A830EHG0_9CREN|nr:aminotransferase class I/II-fold pyridoxal phosphate-dependent enzyme [Vulcanisaeta souniana]BDR91602.1 aminotransferase [Vulcanisaeta souniana JCM 11219]GGI71975.1 aminotransferase [Vulcanisaeta souniana JCM 11219]
MEIGHFIWLRTHRARYDVSSSGVKPIPLNDIVKLGEAGNFIDDLVGIYGVDRKNLAITHGTQEGNFAALTALRELGRIDNVVTVIPEYEPIRVLPKFFHLRQTELNIKESLTELLNHIERDSVLLFSNPNNPLGIFLGRKLLWELSDELRRRNAYAVIDSIFLEFVESNLRDLPMENMVFTFSTSKFYTMSEAKVGWVIGDENVIREVNGVLDLVSPLVIDLNLRYASILLRNRNWVRERNLGIIIPNVDIMRRITHEVSDYVDISYVEYMPILYIRAKCRGISGNILANKLLTRDVFTVPGQYFGRDDGIRVGLGSVTRDDFENAMKIITNVINEVCRDK